MRRPLIPSIAILLATLLGAGTAGSQERLRTQLLESTGNVAQLVLTTEQMREGNDPSTETTHVLVDNTGKRGKPDDALDSVVSATEDLKGKPAEAKYGDLYRSKRNETLADYAGRFLDLASREENSTLGNGNVRIYELSKISDISSPEDRKKVGGIARAYATPFNNKDTPHKPTKTQRYKLVMAEDFDGTEYLALGYSDRTIWFHVTESNRVGQDTVVNLSEPQDSTRSAMSGLVNTFLTLYRGRPSTPQTETGTNVSLGINPSL